jgi:hypothetical protein
MNFDINQPPLTRPQIESRRAHLEHLVRRKTRYWFSISAGCFLLAMLLLFPSAWEGHFPRQEMPGSYALAFWSLIVASSFFLAVYTSVFETKGREIFIFYLALFLLVPASFLTSRFFLVAEGQFGDLALLVGLAILVYVVGLFSSFWLSHQLMVAFDRLTGELKGLCELHLSEHDSDDNKRAMAWFYQYFPVCQAYIDKVSALDRDLLVYEAWGLQEWVNRYLVTASKQEQKNYYFSSEQGCQHD